MALNFPDSPTLNQVYTDSTSGFSYQWDGTVWQSYTSAASKNISIVDDISGSFDGVTDTFALTVSSTSLTPANAQQLRVVLGGIVQEPLTDYTVSASNITFTTPPSGGLDCSIVSLGPAVPVNTIIDGTVTPAKLSTGGPSWNTDGDVYISGITTIADVVKVGVGTTSLIVEGDARITGILTIGTSSVTIDGVNNQISVGTLNITESGISGGTPNITVGFITATGASISGNVDVGGNVSIAGTLTYEDVTNVDSIGIVTARSGVQVTGGELNVTGNSKTSTLQIGTNPAGVSVGVLGIPNQKRIYGRNVANSADVNIAYIDGSNGMVFGPGDAATITSGGNLLIGTSSNTGTASQPLQVNGGAYLNGNLGIGDTNPSSGALAQLSLSGYNSSGGVGYHQFLRIANTYGSATNPNKFFRLDSSGSIEVINSTYTAVLFTFADSGNFTASGNVTGYSDETLKDNIQTIPNALDKVTQLRGVEFDRNDMEGNPHQIGVIAQEVEKIIPEVVTTHNDGIKSVAYGNLVGLLIEAIKDLKEEVNELKARLEEV